MTLYKAAEERYTSMEYRYCGRSGLQLPVISLGLWHNFGSVDVYENYSKIALLLLTMALLILIWLITMVLYTVRLKRISGVY